ncbi:hypothetical protein [Brumimicrobium oceani]|uniref:Uncharacterized protein n=1 Tax=Brumimicrobium oceani TaxID=2100725 RepID=A0A2U2XCT8_9FLAO|nr:hypothetical protein [Brumimicrobium oceani]PWH85583.1 hypothetical protein DIT68_08050 [Brumimicrobium oceani]
MKKTIMILGALTLLITAPTFAQENTTKANNKVSVKANKSEKLVSKKVENPNEKLMVKPEAKTNQVRKPKVENKRKLSEIKSVETRNKKTATRKEEK